MRLTWQRRRALYVTAIALGVLLIAWLMAPAIALILGNLAS